jgi:HAE1 family hydrophobic/amphiphilic exporter-1
METLINDPIEEALNEIDGIETISSTISDGAIFLWAEYEYGEDYDALHREMVQKINEIRNDLPPTVYEIGVSQPSVLDVAIMQLALTGHNISPNQLRLTAERLEERLERIAGVRGVDVVADQQLQLQVKCDFDRMAYHNIKLSDVSESRRNREYGNSGFPGKDCETP